MKLYQCGIEYEDGMVRGSRTVSTRARTDTGKASAVKRAFGSLPADLCGLSRRAIVWIGGRITL